MVEEKDFGHLGQSFQKSLLKTIIEDKKFGESIVEVAKFSYFENGSFRILFTHIQESFQLFNKIPGYDSIEQKIRAESGSNKTTLKMYVDTLNMIKDHKLEDVGQIKLQSLNFCKQQTLKDAIKKVETIMNNGSFQQYNDIEKIMQTAMQVGVTNDEIVDALANPEKALDKESRVAFPTGVTGIDELLKGGLGRCELGVLLAPTGVGKELPISEPVLTPKGWVNNGDLNIGDLVIGSNGLPQNVLGVYPQGIKPIYRVEFTDGTFVNCGLEHLWTVNTLNMRTSKTRVKGIGVYRPNNNYKVVRTSDMMLDIKKRGRYNYRLPIVEPIEFNPIDIKIDPYLLGLLLGDGYLPINSAVCVSTNDVEMFDNIKHLGLHSAFSNYTKSDGHSINVIRFKSGIKSKLNEYNLLGAKSNNKFIPKEFLFNSKDVRLSVLQGLMDTDGYVGKNGINQFSTVSEQLFKDVREIVLSLGGTVNVTTKIPSYKKNGVKIYGQLSYTLTISFSNSVVPFKLTRKIDRFKKREKYINQKFVKSITYSHDEEALCIKVSNPDELYVTRDYVLTHNTTILTKFANSAYKDGANVLQIFFEDNINAILRKHMTIWTGISPDEQPDFKDEVIRVVEEEKNKSKGSLKLMKLPSYGTTLADIKSKIRKYINEGNKVDLLIIDYVDCITSDKGNGDEEWKGEGAIMRGVESMASEFDMAIWVATQGSRASISSEVVTTDQMGGSIKKAQIGHVIISVGKTMEQKEHKLATMTLLKSRIGDDGVVFSNCKFDNRLLIIDTESQNTLLGHKDEVVQKKVNRIQEVYRNSEQFKNNAITTASEILLGGDK